MILRDRLSWTLPIVWVVLFVVSAPILLDYAQHVASNSWAWYVVAFLPITALAISMSPTRKPRAMSALLVVTLGVGIETVAMASGVLRLGRIGFVMAVAAILLLQGRANLRTTALLVLCVPIPHRILERMGETPLLHLTQALATLSRWFGTPALAMGTRIERSAGIFHLDAMDIGWTSATLAFGLTWFACMCSRISIQNSLLGSLLMAIVGALIHLLVTLTLFHHSSSVDPTPLRIWRDLLSYAVVLLGVGVVSVVLIRRRTRSEPDCQDSSGWRDLTPDSKG